MVDSPDLPTLLRVQRATRRMSQQRAAFALGWPFWRYRCVEAARPDAGHVVRLRPTADEIDDVARLFALSPKAVLAAVEVTSYADGSGEAASVA